MTEALSPTVPVPDSQSKDGVSDFLQQFWSFIVALWSSRGRNTLTLLTIGIVTVICATAGGQVMLNAWNGPFYQAIEKRDLPAFTHQLGIFALIAGGLLILNVTQAWLREMIKLQSRRWLTRDLISAWMVPGRAARLAHAGEIGVNPDQRIHEDARRLSELSAEFGIGLFQASLLLVSFIGVLWSLSSGLMVTIGGRELTIPGYMVWCALIYAATGSWFTWLVGRPLVAFNSAKLAREADLRFALVQANEHADSIALAHGEDKEKGRLNLDLDQVLVMMRRIVASTAHLTWVTSGYGWISIVAPIVVAAPAYFGGKLTFGELMVVVGAFYQVNQSLRWFVDNFANIAEWRAVLHRVMKFRQVLLTFETKLETEPRIDYVRDVPGKLALEGVGVASPGEEAVVDRDKVDVKPGDRVMVLDKTKSGKSPLIPAITGLWPWGKGRLEFAPDEKIMLLKDRPYFPEGSLRAVLAYPKAPGDIGDDEAASALARVGLSRLIASLDRAARWEQELSGDDQARLSLAAMLLHKPKWVFCDRPIDIVEDDDHDVVSSIFETELADTALISVARRRGRSSLCDRVVHLTSAS
jgi:vitamin B12/bleomycin/antimicrobial peptide transport system ATP-binding/permease protein